MEFTTSFVTNARQIFLTIEGNSATYLTSELSLENNNLFNRFLITEVSGDEIDIPVIARTHIEEIISDNFQSSSGTINSKTVVLPLYENAIPVTKRSFDSFIKQFFTFTPYSNRLQKITSSKGEVYYGGKGIIFDSEYNPLLLCTLRAEKKLSNIGSFRWYYRRPIIYVNPIVFMEPSKLINKGIIKKIIPYYSNNALLFPSIISGYVNVNTVKSNRAAVIIDDMDKFFVKPTVPKPQSCTMESLNQCLVDNIEDVLQLV